MKPILYFLPVFLLCCLFVFVVPHFVRFPFVRNEILPVSVTALGQAAQNVNTTQHGVSSSEDMIAPFGDGQVMNSELYGFAESLINGQPEQLVGVYSPGLFALSVRQQPGDRPEYVYQENNVVTEFSLPKKYGSTGLLAHNFLSGSRFAQLRENQDVVLVYGDGRLEHYRIDRIAAFQALKPNSPFSKFIDVSNPNNGVLSSADVFNQIYTTRHQLVFQTCIEANGEPSWGRLFIIARLVEPLNLTVPSLSTIPTSN